MTQKEFQALSDKLRSIIPAVMGVVICVVLFQVAESLLRSVGDHGWSLRNLSAMALLIPLPSFVFGMLALRRILVYFSEGNHFGAGVAQALTDLGDNVIAGVLLLVGMVPIVATGRLRFHLEAQDAVLLLLGSLIFLLTFVLRESAKLKKENESFV